MFHVALNTTRRSLLEICLSQTSNKHTTENKETTIVDEKKTNRTVDQRARKYIF